MKVTRLVLIFSVVVLIGTVAEAQCMKCYTERGSLGGTCGPQPHSYPQYCDRQCCGAGIGDPCSIPDFLDECDPWLRTSSSNARGSLLTVPAKAKVAPAAYFTTSRPIETRQEAIHRRLQQLDPRAPKCGSI